MSIGADQRSQGLAFQLARQPGRCKAFEKPALDPAGVGATRFVQEADARFRQLFPCPNTPLNYRTSWWLGRGASMGDITLSADRRCRAPFFRTSALPVFGYVEPPSPLFAAEEPPSLHPTLTPPRIFLDLLYIIW